MAGLVDEPGTAKQSSVKLVGKLLPNWVQVYRVNRQKDCACQCMCTSGELSGRNRTFCSANMEIQLITDVDMGEPASFLAHAYVEKHSKRMSQ